VTATLTNLSRCKPLLGTYVSIDLSAELDFDELVRISSLGYEAITKVHNLMSYHQTDSQLSQINTKAHLAPILLNPHTEAVINFSLELAEKTNGIFDPCIALHLVKQGLLPNYNQVLTNHSHWENILIYDHHITFSKPTHLDLGGIAKGYAVDQAKAVMVKEFIRSKITEPHITINAGGDLTETHWQNKLINIRHPRTGAPFKKIEMLNAALATSSYCYQEKGKRPIINPISREPLNLTRSISIFSPSCMISDALTKIYALAPDSTIHQEYQAHPVII
tara:strand:- start:2197 stop:3030 length:834 start_codon:yes stop_codon:yes gene_type:complete